ncbi:MAG TPA: response regulator transcription factor [Solirubrobacter sp.]
MIRLALLDDHPAVLSGLQRLLAPAPDMEVLAAASDEVALARELRGRRPDILIVDYDPARGDALSLCRRVKARPDTPRVLVYTAYAGPALTVAARAAQADGVIDKSEPARTLIAAIRRIADGETVMPAVSRTDFEAAVARLDEGDLPVFAMLLDGTPVPEIAEGLHTDERRAARRAQKIVARLRPQLDPSDAFAEAQGSISPRRIA